MVLKINQKRRRLPRKRLATPTPWVDAQVSFDMPVSPRPDSDNSPLSPAEPVAQTAEALLKLPAGYDFEALFVAEHEALGEAFSRSISWSLDNECPQDALEDDVLGNDDNVPSTNSDDELESDDLLMDLPSRPRPFNHKYMIAQAGKMPSRQQLRENLLGNVKEVRIGGGGARGYIFPGFFHAVQRYGGLSIDRPGMIFSGISVGCALALCLALGMNDKALADFTFRLDGHRLKDMTRRSILGVIGNMMESFGHRCRRKGIGMRILGAMIGGLGRFLRWVANVFYRWGRHSWGMCEGKGLRDTMHELFANSKVKNADPTFQDLADAGIDFRAVTSVVCCKGRRVWAAHTDPEQKVIPVVVASMSVPGGFQPFRDEHGHIHTDGGVPNNVPPSDPKVRPEESCLFMFANEKEKAVIDGGHAHEPVHNVLDFISGVFLSSRIKIDAPEKGIKLGYVVSSKIEAGQFEASLDVRVEASKDGFRSGIAFLEKQVDELEAKYSSLEKRRQAHELTLAQRAQGVVKSCIERAGHSGRSQALPKTHLKLYYETEKAMHAARARLQGTCTGHTIEELTCNYNENDGFMLDATLKKGVFTA